MSSKRSAAAQLRRDRRAAITVQAQRPVERSSPESAETVVGWFRGSAIERACQRRGLKRNDRGCHRHCITLLAETK